MPECIQSGDFYQIESIIGLEFWELLNNKNVYNCFNRLLDIFGI